MERVHFFALVIALAILIVFICALVYLSRHSAARRRMIGGVQQGTDQQDQEMFGAMNRRAAADGSGTLYMAPQAEHETNTIADGGTEPANGQDAMTMPQPGWYDDPDDANAERYWDGVDWTPHRQRTTTPAKPQSMSPITSSAPPQSPAAPTAPLPSSPMPVIADPFALPATDQHSQWSAPAPPPAGVPPKRFGKPILITALVGALAIVVIGAVLADHLFAGASDDDQIKAVTQKLAEAYNNADGAAFQALLCNQAKAAPGESGFLKEFAGSITASAIRDDLSENGTLAMSVSDIRVAGDRATASVTYTRSKSPGQKQTETDPYVKENGTWKPCPADNG